MAKYFFDDFEIPGSGNFLECVKILKNGECDYLYGPQGGIIKMDEKGYLTYRDNSPILFSAENYLGIWRLLIKKQDRDSRAGEKSS